MLDLNDIFQPVDEMALSSIRLLVYGEPGIGKTTLARTLPGKTLVLSAEGGLLPLMDSGITSIDIRNYKGQAIPDDKKLTFLKNIHTEIITGKYKIDNIFIDSISEIDRFSYAVATAAYPESKHKMLKFGVHGEAINPALHLWMNVPGVNVIMVSAAKEYKDEHTGLTKMRPMMNGGIREEILAWPDGVFYMEKDEQGVRSLHTTSGRNRNNIPFAAKIRESPKGEKLSAVEPADLSVILTKIRGA